MTLALISDESCALHEMGDSHPENPLRIKVINDAILKSNLINKFKKCNAPKATQLQLLRAHEKNYIDFIFKSSPKEGLIFLDPDTLMNPFTLSAALHAAGSVVEAVDLVINQKVQRAFCNIRPPGHHATRRAASGFCFFNNIAIGVLHALDFYKLKRIAIIDFDVHHGNGTEDIFANDPRVLLCSSFQSPFYPYTFDQTNSNIPLPSGTTFKELFNTAVVKWISLVENFAPEMIFFSAGFDGHKNDPLANFALETSDFGLITKPFIQLADKYCNGRVVSVLEGGYCLEVLGDSVVAHLKEF